MPLPFACRAQSGRRWAASPAPPRPFRGMRAVLGLGLLACAMSASPQGQQPSAASARPKNVEQSIERLAGTARAFPPAPGDQNPADLDSKAKALGKAGLDEFFKGTDNAKRAAGIAKIEQALARDPRMPEAYGALFMFYVTMQRDVGRAIAHLESGVKHCPQSPGVRTHLGNAYSAAGRPRDAIEQFNAAFKLSPAPVAQASLHYNIGNQQQKLGDLPGAIASWRSALKADDKHLNARRNLAIAHYQSGSLDAARKEAERLIELDPNGKFGDWGREALRSM